MPGAAIQSALEVFVRFSSGGKGTAELADELQTDGREMDQRILSSTREMPCSAGAG
jgi:hypothetical protein